MVLKLDNFKFNTINDEFKLFDVNTVKFTEDLYYCDVNDIDTDEQRQELAQFGVNIRNNSYYIPSAYVFLLLRSYERGAYCDIMRNGIRLPLYDITDLYIEVDLTNFGTQCEKAAKALGKTIEEVREEIIEYSKHFKIIIEK